MSKPLEDLNDDELALLIRRVAGAVDKCGPEGIGAAVQPLCDAGVVANMCMGEEAKSSRRNKMLWFAGQILNMIESEAWFAVNSWLNMCVIITGGPPLVDAAVYGTAIVSEGERK